MNDYRREYVVSAAAEQWNNVDPERDERMVDDAERQIMRELLQRLTGGPGPYWDMVERRVRDLGGVG